LRGSNALRPWICAILLAACGSGVGPNGHLVGAQCSIDRDCSVFCTHNSDFGNGMCTRPCASDLDCPRGSVCVTPDGGICAVSCQNDNDCSGFGRAFVCGGMSRASGGSTLVCRVP
jgi:hypothetical protein